MATHPLECPTKSRPYEYCSVGLPAVPLVSGGAIDTRGFGAVGDTVVGVTGHSRSSTRGSHERVAFLDVTPFFHLLGNAQTSPRWEWLRDRPLTPKVFKSQELLDP